MSVDIGLLCLCQPISIKSPSPKAVILGEFLKRVIAGVSSMLIILKPQTPYVGMFDGYLRMGMSTGT